MAEDKKLTNLTNQGLFQYEKPFTIDEYTGAVSYNGFSSEVNFNFEDEVFYGRLDVPGVCSFEGETFREFLSNFKEAVEEYLEFMESYEKISLEEEER